MICPGCGCDLDLELACQMCGRVLTIAEEMELRAQLPAPRTRAIEEEKFDAALRWGDD